MHESRMVILMLHVWKYNEPKLSWTPESCRFPRSGSQTQDIRLVFFYLVDGNARTVCTLWSKFYLQQHHGVMVNISYRMWPRDSKHVNFDTVCNYCVFNYCVDSTKAANLTLPRIWVTDSMIAYLLVTKLIAFLSIDSVLLVKYKF